VSRGVGLDSSEHKKTGRLLPVHSNPSGKCVNTGQFLAAEDTEMERRGAEVGVSLSDARGERVQEDGLGGWVVPDQVGDGRWRRGQNRVAVDHPDDDRVANSRAEEHLDLGAGGRRVGSVARYREVDGVRGPHGRFAILGLEGYRCWDECHFCSLQRKVGTMVVSR